MQAPDHSALQPLDPFQIFRQEMETIMRDAVEQAFDVASRQEQIPESAPFAPARHPYELMTTAEVRDYLRFSKSARVYEIPETDLPVRKVGRGRGSNRYFYIDVLRYAAGLPPIDIQGTLEEQEQRAHRPVGPVKVHGKGRHRLT